MYKIFDCLCETEDWSDFYADMFLLLVVYLFIKA